MIPLPADDPCAAFRHFARDWFRLLSCGNDAEAVLLLDEPNSYGELWDARKIREVIQDYAGSDSVRVSDPDSIPGDGSPNMGEFNDGRGWWFEHNVPLDGDWSDLTAQFEFLRRAGGCAAVLHDLHVM